jgi:hypothetical protein
VEGAHYLSTQSERLLKLCEVSGTEAAIAQPDQDGQDVLPRGEPGSELKSKPAHKADARTSTIGMQCAAQLPSKLLALVTSDDLFKHNGFRILNSCFFSLQDVCAEYDSETPCDQTADKAGRSGAANEFDPST